MKAKLTLMIEDKVIDSAKKYARKKKANLSDIMENYLRLISANEAKAGDFSPKVVSLKGVIKLPEDFDYKKAIGKIKADNCSTGKS